MATERPSMRHTREILRQKLLLGRSHREVARSLDVSVGTVGATVLRARALGLDWAQAQALADDALEASTARGSRRGPPGPCRTASTSTPSCADRA